MGVHSLWGILEPTSRPVRLESLSRKRMAVDASIWIYQFLKAVRDKSGNSMTSSHIVGFFRRICKLLYFGIQPVFVFDGGAPILKRETINKRKERRQGKRDDDTKTAQKLLALQLQKKQEQLSKASKNVETSGDERIEYHYLEDQDIANNEIALKSTSTQPKFKGSDEYDLPHIRGFEYDREDGRILNQQEEIKDAVEYYDELEGIDLNTIDPASKEFEELPLTTQYMVLSQLRLRSRLRMGYSKEQLENIFPDSIDFSKFQIQMVQKRNYFTQRLMNISGMDDGKTQVRRVAGERGKEYKIQKTEGGWALSLGDAGSSSSNPVDLEKIEKKKAPKPGQLLNDIEEEDDDIDWEDISLENKEKAKINQSISALPLPPMAADIEAHDSTIKSFMAFSPQKNKIHKRPPLKDEVIEIDEKDTSQEQAIRQIEEIELIEAIERSKADLRKEQELEKSLDSSNGKQDSDFEDFEDIGFEIEDKPSTSESHKISKSEQNDQRLKQRIEFDHLLNLNNDDGSSKSAQPSNNVPKSNSFNLLNSNGEPMTPKLFGLVREQTTAKLLDEDNLSNSTTEEPTISQKDHPSDDKKIPSVPSWFNTKYDQTFNMNPSTLTKRKQDSSIGLVSWGEAQEILANKQAAENSEFEGTIKKRDSDSNEDIEVVNLESDDENNKEIKQEVVDPKTVSPRLNPSTDSKEKFSNDSNKGFINENLNEKEKSNKISEQDVEGSSSSSSIFDYEFSEEEEEELNVQLRKEEKEHEEFQKDLNPNVINTFLALDSSNLESNLNDQRRRELRDSDEVTLQMVKEVQELLANFGIPYITAPMEAEAQCGELLRLKLVDGIITDDSDVFLFGGDKVYKNMFHEKHYVEYYNGDEIDKKLGLNRLKLIELAHLLGSDYTEGLKGIGPVNAMEILANFTNLENFRDWFLKNQFDIQSQKNETNFQQKLRKKLVKLDSSSSSSMIDKSFPDKRINQAYLKPEVDSDKTEFVWGIPDLDRLRGFLMSTVGWNKERVDQVLIPLIKDLNKKKREGVQSTLNEFYDDIDYLNNNRKKFKKSNKRLNEATNKMNKLGK
ncbi:hypothetical protein WICMUC_002014 [Wickerhamomyces mucosus]|uniref:DNA repair protein RAD2 n=1 Tax=Wickerhamomyces mucosus TaxID=1378264 RepID=A0A9P8TEA7_9ASCO|nr:hypothetical protein WICMUC_002014 [Wickerhamomyces mucosus]